MNSPFANLFLALQQLISNLADGDGNKYFRLVDQDLGQLEAHFGDNRPPVSWPCVLIDIDGAAMENMGDDTQTGVVTIIFRIGFPPFSASSNITPANYKNKALYYYDLEQVLHLALHGKSPEWIVDDENILADVFGHMIRTSARTERREDMIRVREITYTLSFDDYSTQPQQQLVSPVTLELTTEYEE